MPAPRISYPLPKAIIKKNITQLFGNPSNLYQSRIHPGLDIGVPAGTPIQATGDGEIIRVWKGHPTMGNACLYRFTLYGKVLTSRFLHLREAPKLGKYVDGQVIAFTGNTGLVHGKNGGAHLHWELWKSPYNVIHLYKEASVLKHLVDPLDVFPLS